MPDSESESDRSDRIAIPIATPNDDATDRVHPSNSSRNVLLPTSPFDQPNRVPGPLHDFLHVSPQPHWAPPILDIANVTPIKGGWEASGAHGRVREGV